MPAKKARGATTTATPVTHPSQIPPSIHSASDHEDDQNDRKEPDDPLVAECDVYITPRLAGTQTYVLKFSNSNQQDTYNRENGTAPQSMRIKPKNNYLEMEVPVNTSAYFNKTRSLKWGRALVNSNEEGPNPFGIASGFFPNRGSMRRLTTSAPDQGGAGTTTEQSVEDLVENFEEEAKHGKALTKRTLGGQILPRAHSNLTYALGSFRGSQLHFTTVDGTVPMLPQYYHVDALALSDRIEVGRGREAAEPSRREPRAVQMSYKSTEQDGHGISITDRQLNAIQEEVWSNLNHHDESSGESWNLFDKGFHVEDVTKAQLLASAKTKEQYLDAMNSVQQL
ncbi:MAG: hypothetical protein M1820_001130 [Bogoriella megaspora]|nr:MAG: hypothetical protein M1820_001130 [Bogoriella megaspora]